MVDGGRDGEGVRVPADRGHAVALPIPGLTLTLARDFLWLRGGDPLRILSSGPGGDGVTAARHVISQYVDTGYCCDEPERDLAALAARLGIAASEPWVGLMTGVALDTAAVTARRRAGLTVAAVVTVGLGNLSAAGRDPWRAAVPPAAPPAGTINTIVILDAALTPAALVNAVVTATEAKTLALVEGGLRTKGGDLASGTSSDAVVIAATGRGPSLRYAGPATLAGLLIGEAVREATASRLPARRVNRAARNRRVPSYVERERKPG